MQLLCSELLPNQARCRGQVNEVLIYLSRADFNVEVASFIGDLEDFWPGESVDPEAVSVDEQTIGTHTKHYINSL